MAKLTNRAGQSAESDQAGRGKQPDGQSLKDFDVIYIGGFPPLRQIWADIKTVIRQRHELSRARMVSRTLREAEMMAESANHSEQIAESEQAERTYGRSGKLPPGKLDVIYIGGIPPLRQVWQDMKELFRERRDSRR